MAKKIPKATHMGELKIGGGKIPCAVLEDGTRVFTQTGFLQAIGKSGRPWGGRQRADVEQLPAFLRGKALNPFINKELSESSTPIIFTPLGGGRAYGYKAEILPQVCDVYLQARESGRLPKNQQPTAQKCEILVRGFASVGIVALVDEATGYQYARSRKALEEILDQFIEKELRKWAKTFPDEFYKELFRLRGWQYVPFLTKRTAQVGKDTNDIVYERLAPGVLDELKRKNPVTPTGRRKHKHHQWLTEHVGHPRLREHLSAVIALMKVSNDWKGFQRLLNRAFDKHPKLPLFPDQ